MNTICCFFFSDVAAFLLEAVGVETQIWLAKLDMLDSVLCRMQTSKGKNEASQTTESGVSSFVFISFLTDTLIQGASNRTISISPSSSDCNSFSEAG